MIFFIKCFLVVESDNLYTWLYDDGHSNFNLVLFSFLLPVVTMGVMIVLKNTK